MMARRSTALGLTVVVLIALAVLGGLGAWVFNGDAGPSPLGDPGRSGMETALPGDSASRPEGAAPHAGDTGGPSSSTVTGTATADLPGSLVLAGRVFTPDGDPVAGAQVTATRGLRVAPGRGPRDLLVAALAAGPAGMTTTTDAEGRFALSNLAAGRWELVATAAGWAPGTAGHVVTHESGSARPVLLHLSPAFDLEVHVVDPDDRPIAGVQVGALPGGNRFGLETLHQTVTGTTDETGTLVLRGLPAGRLILAVTQGPLIAVQGRHEVPSDTPVVLRLGGTAALTVLVRDGAGRPVDGARVQAVIDDRGTGGLLAGTTGPDGTLAWTQLPSGRVPIIHAEKAGLGLAATGGIGGRRASGDMITLTDNETTLHEMTLAPGAVVTGVVRLGPDGPPVADARVRLLSAALVLLRPLTETRTRPDGSFRFEHVPPGMAAVGAAAPGAVATAEAGNAPFRVLTSARTDAPGTFLVPEQGEVVRDIELQAPAVVTGHVVTAAGDPVPGAEVGFPTTSGGAAALIGEDPFGVYPAPVLAGADGRFRLAGVPPGEDLHLEVRARGYRDATSPAFATTAGGAVDDLEIRVSLGAAVRGRVLDADGNALGGVTVRALVHPAGAAAIDYANQSWRFRSSSETLSADDGSFTIAGLDAGRVWLQAAGPGHVDRTLAGPVVTEDSTGTVTIELTTGRVIAGQVRDAGGRPVADARIFARLESDDTRAPGANGSARTDAEGRFEVPGLVAGSFSLRVTADGQPPLVRPGVAAGDRGIALTFESPEAIGGRVEGPDGAPVEGAGVGLQGPDGRQVRGGRTDADGAFLLGEIAPGTYTLTVAPTDAFAGTRVAGITAGSRDLRIRLQPGLSITGRVVDEAGAVVLGRGFVQVQDASGRRISARGSLDAKTGQFRVTGLETGTFQIVVQVFGERRRTGRATATAGDTDTVVTVR